MTPILRVITRGSLTERFPAHNRQPIITITQTGCERSIIFAQRPVNWRENTHTHKKKRHHDDIMARAHVKNGWWWLPHCLPLPSCGDKERRVAQWIIFHVTRVVITQKSHEQGWTIINHLLSEVKRNCLVLFIWTFICYTLCVFFFQIYFFTHSQCRKVTTALCVVYKLPTTTIIEWLCMNCNGGKKEREISSINLHANYIRDSHIKAESVTKY